MVAPVGGRELAAHERSVEARSFEVMRIPVVAGRAFNESDTAGSQPVAIVSQAYARLAFEGQNPLGKRLDLDETKPVIIGVVGDVRHQSVKEPRPRVLPAADARPERGHLPGRADPDRPDRTAAAIRTVVRDLAPTQPVERITTLGAIVDDTTAGDRFYAVTTGAFGGIALLLAVSGLIGVVRRGVTERTRELAIRNALGADAGRLVRGTVLQELRPVLLAHGPRPRRRVLALASAAAVLVRGVAARSVGVRRGVLAAARDGARRLLLPRQAHHRIDPATALRAE